MTGNPEFGRQVVFGRRQGHKLRPQRQALMRDLLPQIGIDLENAADTIEPRALFAPGTKEVWLEIGFGAGEHAFLVLEFPLQLHLHLDALCAGEMEMGLLE
ncbi:MAG: hypothetical protein HN527_15095, partial [Rhodospirillaceae bacterium]|nr:hypothetical protein [Rhodospirillaceae bacterium]